MISVIVPVYNCERYLKKSIKSLINQTIFNELEIIFVDDGSEDESALIIQHYVNQHSNMKLIRQSNKGVSAARNRGIEEAAGEYIAFFDADDIAHMSLYERLLNLIVNNDADLSCVNYSMYFEDGFKKVHKKKKKKLFFNEEVIKSFFASDMLCNNTVDKLFRSSIVKDNLFPEGYSIGEDMFFIFQYLMKTKKVIVDTTESLYLYCIHPQSAMKSEFSEKYFDTVILSKKMMDMLNLKSTLYLYAEANWIHEICKSLALYYQSGCTDYKDIIAEYENNIKSYPLNKAFKYLSKKHFISLVIMRISPEKYIKIYKKLHIG